MTMKTTPGRQARRASQSLGGSLRLAIYEFKIRASHYRWNPSALGSTEDLPAIGQDNQNFNAMKYFEEKKAIDA